MSCRTVVFISGRGSNLKALLANQRHFSVECVLSNREDAAGLMFADAQGIPTFTAPRDAFNSVREQKSALYKKTEELQPNLILLAGYMQIIDADFIHQYENRILNIHPSLLPAFPGLEPHRKAIESGAQDHGCTVHLVTPEVDSGPLLAQMSCEIRQEETEESLASRVLELEHQLYPWVVNAIAGKELIYHADGRLESSDALKKEATERKITIAP